MRIFLIHGAYGNSNENWFPHLRDFLTNKGIEVISPDFPTPENQSLGNWTWVFDKNYLDKVDEETVFIGHSLGPAFILSILERLDFQIKKCIFVAPFISELGNPKFDSINKSFYRKFDFEKIKNNCKEFIVFYSENDPYVKVERALEVVEKLQARPINIKNGGHFNKDAGFTKFIEILKYV